jgi:glycerol kinase
MHWISSAHDLEKLSLESKDNGNLYFVPAFAGLYSPYWREDATGLLIGMSHHTTRHHLARAVLEAPCYRSAEVIQAM